MRVWGCTAGYELGGGAARRQRGSNTRLSRATNNGLFPGLTNVSLMQQVTSPVGERPVGASPGQQERRRSFTGRDSAGFVESPGGGRGEEDRSSADAISRSQVCTLVFGCMNEVVGCRDVGSAF